MSFSITITGHSPNPHNDAVKAIVYNAVQALKALEGSVSVTGYTYDQSGVNFQLTDSFIADEEAREAAANAPEPEPAAEEPAPQGSEPAPAGGEAPPAETVNTPAPPETPPVADSTESAPVASGDGA